LIVLIPRPTLLAPQGNTLKRNYPHDMGSKPHLILNLREAVWQEFFDSVIAGVRMSEEQVGKPRRHPKTPDDCAVAAMRRGGLRSMSRCCRSCRAKLSLCLSQ